MALQIIPVEKVKGAFIVHPPRYHDERGYFQEQHNVSKYGEVVKKCEQTSFSYSKKNVLRGLHCSRYGKLVQCLRGKLVDVFVDLREDSPTFLNWASVELNDVEAKQVFVPGGCGHGFFSCEDNSILLYTQEGTFDPPTEMNINYADPELKIEWPKPIDSDTYIVSVKDNAAPTAREALCQYKERNKQ